METRTQKTDKWFIFLSIIASLLIISDASLTYLGLSLGWTEGNPLMRWLFAKWDIVNVLILVTLTSCLLLVLINIIKHKVKNLNFERFCYFSMSLIILSRSFVVGSWIVIIQMVV